MRCSRFLALLTCLSLPVLANEAHAASGTHDASVLVRASATRSDSDTYQVSPYRLSVQFERYEQAVQAASERGARFIHLPRISKFKGLACGYIEYNSRAIDGAAMEVRKASVGTAPGIRFVGYDHRTSVADVRGTPNDPNFSQLWGMPKISAPSAWDTYSDASDVVVAILDTGTNFAHPDLAPNLWTNPDEIPDNGIDDDENGYVDDIHGIDPHNKDSDPRDDHGHGSHCAGTVGAAGNNGIGIAGVAWKTQIMTCKILGGNGSGDVSVVAECMEYILAQKEKGHHITVTSNSWGVEGYDANIETAFQAAGAANILNSCAAGNSADNNDTSSKAIYPSTYDDESIIAVMSSDSSDQRSSFSNYGQTSVDIAAPGSNIYSCSHSGSGYVNMSGTSMAAPHISGALALLTSYAKSDDIPTIRAALLDGADKISGFASLSVTGGRLNLAASLAALEPGDEWEEEDEGSTSTGTDTDSSDEDDDSDSTDNTDTTDETDSESTETDESETETEESESTEDSDSTTQSEDGDSSPDESDSSSDSDESETEESESDEDEDEDEEKSKKDLSSKDDSGCGCTTRDASTPFVWLSALTFGWFLRRRQKRNA